MTSTVPWNGYVLVVEASEETRETLVRVLLGSGYHVAASASGAEAVEYLRRGVSPCLVLFDPSEVMVGSELLLAERMPGSALDGTPLVLLGVSVEAELAITVGAADCLLKPIDLGVLLQVVQRYCRPASRSSGPNGGHDRGLSVGAG